VPPVEAANQARLTSKSRPVYPLHDELLTEPARLSGEPQGRELDEYLKATEDPGVPTPAAPPPPRPAPTARPRKEFAFLPPQS
jgi:hypothetical protein